MFRVAVFSSKSYDEKSLTNTLGSNDIELQFFDVKLNAQTSTLTKGFDAVCVFVNDDLNRDVLEQLSKHGVKAIALRCAGFNNVDIATCRDLNIRVARVPAYSPEAVAEHAIALMMTLNRHLHKAYNRTKDDNFSLEGLLGFNIHGKTVGLIGTGNIGLATARILLGFGAHVIAYDPTPSEKALYANIEFVELNDVFERADIISLHCPLTPQTQHLINNDAINKMKDGVMLINTSRGGLIDTQSLVGGLKSGKIGNLALDVYEQESELFFEDHSTDIIKDDVFQRLLTFPNVLITGHQGFFTKEALEQIASTTLYNLRCFKDDETCENEL